MSAAAPGSEVSARVRLHITPFNPQLLDRIIPPSIKPLASDISFHEEQAYPERGFGYVELPAMEAQKLKQKLNGTTLKGSKVRIEEAKPERKRKVEAQEEAEDDAKIIKKVKKEKRKREEGVLPGHELEEGRRVKRGWTDGEAQEVSKKRRKASESRDAAEESTEGRQLRFKTIVPPNKAPLPDKAKDKSKKKDKEEKRERKKKTVVHEFGKTKKSRDVKLSESQITNGKLHYEDGKGWVDQTGVLVDPERPSKKPKHNRVVEAIDVPTPVPAKADSAMEISPVEPDLPIPTAEANDGEPGDTEDSSGSEDRDAALNPNAEAQVHPLEALFKRPAASPTSSNKPKPKPIDTTFSFFNSSAAEEEDDQVTDMPPQTPHTKMDLEWRSMRSAAPTPDTAAIGRTFNFPFAENYNQDEAEPNEDDEVMDDGEHEAALTQAKEESRGEESAFRTWFYEHRGEFNRGWKRRRREERKHKRQSENRKLNQKVS